MFQLAGKAERLRGRSYWTNRIVRVFSQYQCGTSPGWYLVISWNGDTEQCSSIQLYADDAVIYSTPQDIGMPRSCVPPCLCVLSALFAVSLPLMGGA